MSEEKRAVDEAIQEESREALWAAFTDHCKTPGHCTQWGMMPVACMSCGWDRPLVKRKIEQVIDENS